MRIPSKTYRQMYVQWMQQKTLRSRLLYEAERVSIFQSVIHRSRGHLYLLMQSKHENYFHPIGEFNQHSNSSKYP